MPTSKTNGSSSTRVAGYNSDPRLEHGDSVEYHFAMMTMLDGLDQKPLMHSRSYDTQVYRDGDHMIVVGRVQDEKPPGMYISDDPDPLEIHHMVVALKVAIGELRIVDAQVEFITHPNAQCPSIVDHYRKLIGLSVARGFNRKVRELFGGPRACTHTTALLQAMAPVVVQAMWSVRMDDRRAAGHDPFDPRQVDDNGPCLLYTSPSPRDRTRSRMPSSA